MYLKIRMITCQDIKYLEGNDRYAKERRELNKKINFYNDGKSCERVVAKVFRRHNS